MPEQGWLIQPWQPRGKQQAMRLPPARTRLQAFIDFGHQKLRNVGLVVEQVV